MAPLPMGIPPAQHPPDSLEARVVRLENGFEQLSSYNNNVKQFFISFGNIPTGGTPPSFTSIDNSVVNQTVTLVTEQPAVTNPDPVVIPAPDPVFIAAPAPAAAPVVVEPVLVETQAAPPAPAAAPRVTELVNWIKSRIEQRPIFTLSLLNSANLIEFLERHETDLPPTPPTGPNPQVATKLADALVGLCEQRLARNKKINLTKDEIKNLGVIKDLIKSLTNILSDL